MQDSQTGEAGYKPTVVKPQSPICAWHGLTLANCARFFALGPPWHWTRLPKVASVWMAAAVNSALGCVENAAYGRKIRQVELDESPLFVLGHWRSGTTLLHNLLACDPHYTFCNLYQVLFPGHFLLTQSAVTRATASALPKRRPMDNMKVSWDLPQEDETALCLMTLLSPYLMLAFHNDSSVYDRYFELADITPAERERWKRAFLTFARKLTLKDPRPDGGPKRLLIKSPTHTYRIPLLLEMFPKAKFLFISRNPYAVYSSTLHLRRTMFVENGLGLNNFTGLEEMTLKVYRHLFECYERDRHLIPAGQLCEMRFEDLEVDPLRELERVYGSLGLPGFDELQVAAQKELEGHESYRKNAYRLDPESMQRVYQEWQPAFERFGYNSDIKPAEIKTA